MTLLAPLQVQAGQGALYLLDESTSRTALTAALRATRTIRRHRNWRWAAACWANARRTASHGGSTRCRMTTRESHSQLGRRTRATCRVLPLLHGERVMGVLELAGFDAPSESGPRLLMDELLPQLAMSLEIKARHRARCRPWPPNSKRSRLC